MIRTEKEKYLDSTNLSVVSEDLDGSGNHKG